MSKIRLLVANDVYLPAKDGVVNCMRNYLINYSPDEVEPTAMFPNPGKFVIEDKCYDKITYPSITVPGSAGARFGFPNLSLSLKKQLEEREFDIIHVHGPFGVAKYLLKYAKKHGIPIVCTYHTNYIYIFKKIFKLRFIWEPYIKSLGRCYSAMTEVFAGTESTYKQLLEYGFNSKCSILPFGTFFNKDEDRELWRKRGQEKFGIEESRRVFCFVGRMVESKRVQETLKALSILKRNGRDFLFLAVGIGNYQQALKNQAEILNLRNNVRFLGKVSDEELKMVYSVSDMLLFPSLLDNFALVKVEAASFKTPGLFIKGSNTAHGTIDDVDAFHCDDSPESLANKADLVFTDLEKVQRVGFNANQNLVVTWKEATDVLVKQYQRIIAEHKESNS